MAGDEGIGAGTKLAHSLSTRCPVASDKHSAALRLVYRKLFSIPTRSVTQYCSNTKRV